MIEKQLEIMRRPRLNIVSTLNNFSLEQLNKIPAGFNNNIIWNLGHMIAAQQGVCYKRAGLNTWVDDAFFQRYKPESKPEGPVDAAGFEEIKTLLTTSLDQLEHDYKNGIFGTYPAWTTRYGVTMASIDDALAFLPFHEGLHIGYIMAMRKLV
ncbi:DinB family protein [Mucilaginibacter sp. 14171R-50]|uniref:DinB family protein n=1 Tax=Mucilaginibacter sp. 14171R-50 TaxID=2703789 RepID=UPI001EE4BF34|nr:DinB family protein [Mucilaginibacter sp. 14171R-50]